MHKGECIFCKIVSGEINAKIIAENEHAIAFLDAFPISDGHALVIPKKHYLDLSLCDDVALIDVIKLVKKVAINLEDVKKLNPWGFNFLSNQGKIAGQEIMHFHIHVIPKYIKNKGFVFKNEATPLQYTTEQVSQLISKGSNKITKKLIKKAILKNKE